MNIAIIGGTFNPPHFGHLFFANEVRQRLQYDKIVFVPSAVSAHKKRDKYTTNENRLEMLHLALENIPWALISDCDLKRGGVTRTIDTINDICKEFSLNNKPGFIIGDDLVKGFDKWKDPETIAKRANIVIGIRENHDFSFNYRHFLVKNRVFPLSSSEIRDCVKKGYDIDFLLPKKVIEYIHRNELYKLKK